MKDHSDDDSVILCRPYTQITPISWNVNSPEVLSSWMLTGSRFQCAGDFQTLWSSFNNSKDLFSQMLQKHSQTEYTIFWDVLNHELQERQQRS